MLKVTVTLAIAALLVGCASQSAPKPMAVAATTTVAPAAGAASTTEAARSATTAPPGYKARVRKGQTVYCKTVEVTGSNFPKEVCYTPEALAAMERLQKDSAGRILNKPVACNSNSCAAPAVGP